MDGLIESLSLLNYATKFCKKQNFPPLHHYYFTLSHNSHDQFHYFITLCAWLLNLCNVKFDKPGQFDDPNVSVAAIIIELRNLNLTCDLTNTKLRQGYGESVIGALQALADIATKKIVFAKPVFKNDDAIEEAEVNEEAEIIADIEYLSNSEDEDVQPMLSPRRNQEQVKTLVKEKDTLDRQFDMTEWKMEVERVTPLLKIHLNNNQKDWRLHMTQFKTYKDVIDTSSDSTKTKMDKIEEEITKSIEKVTSREKYVASHFESQASEHRLLQDQLTKLKQEYSVSNSKLTELSNELAATSETLEVSKFKMDEIGSGMTDAKPLVTIKQALIKLKLEIKQMDLRSGVIDHSLLHGKLAQKRFYFSVDKVGGLVMDQ